MNHRCELAKMTVVRKALPAVVRFGSSALLVYLITVFYFHFVHVNPATVALTYLMAILAISAAWGLKFAVPISAISALCFNFYFLPPVGTFTIADTQNWVAFTAFIVVSIVASHLSERARAEAREATRRRTEVEKLY